VVDGGDLEHITGDQGWTGFCDVKSTYWCGHWAHENCIIWWYKVDTLSILMISLFYYL